MAGRRGLIWLAALVGLLAASGASCPNMVRQYTAPMPRLLPEGATAEQIIQVVNRNSSSIESFITREAKVTAAGLPTLQVDIVYQKPRRFRMRAETLVTGAEVDIGSNDELFWFWIRRPAPATVYFCRHDEYAASPARRMLPIDPNWLIESLGIVYLDPRGAHQGPFPLGDGRLELRKSVPTPEGTLTRVTVVDAQSGCVTQQRIHDPAGNLVARARAENHRLDPLSGLVLPRVVTIDSPPAQFSITVELGNADINPEAGVPDDLFRVPKYENSRVVNLATAAPALPAGQ